MLGFVSTFVSCPVLPFHRRLSAAGYASDGASVRPSVCANGSLPAPRAVSNALFSVAHLLNRRQVNDLHTAFGLLISADLSNSRNFNASVPITPLAIPPNDPVFASGYAIPFRRAQPIPGTGTSSSNPLQHINKATSWLDLEPIYGHNVETGPVAPRVLSVLDDWLLMLIGCAERDLVSQLCRRPAVAHQRRQSASVRPAGSRA